MTLRTKTKETNIGAFHTHSRRCYTVSHLDRENWHIQSHGVAVSWLLNTSVTKNREMFGLGNKNGGNIHNQALQAHSSQPWSQVFMMFFAMRLLQPEGLLTIAVDSIHLANTNRAPSSMAGEPLKKIDWDVFRSVLMCQTPWVLAGGTARVFTP